MNTLQQGFTWQQHFAPQSQWLQEEAYSKTIVIRYDKAHLGDKINKVLDLLHIPRKDEAFLKMVNVSASGTGTPGAEACTDTGTAIGTTSEAKEEEAINSERLELKPSELKALKRLFADDFELWRKLQTHQALFRIVV